MTDPLSLSSMTHYQVIARKYRPQLFRDVVGQDAIVKTILNSLRLKKTAHAYLFSGSRGTGKTTLARLFAKALNCQSPQSDCEPCNQCPSCMEIASGNALDVLEIDGASNRGIEDVRKISEMSLYAPSGNHTKIYLIDEVHMLTKEAFNALLKLLEEPPEKVKFLFCTTEVHKLPATIISRCQRFQLAKISPAKIEEKLSQICQEMGVEIEKGALHILAKLAMGGLRDAQMLLDEMIACYGQKLTAAQAAEVFGIVPAERFLALDEAAEKQDVQAAILLAQEVYASGYNLECFLEELIGHFRGHLLAKKTRASSIFYSESSLLDILEMLVKTASELKFAFSEKTQLEMALVRVVRLSKQLTLEHLIERLLALEGRLEGKRSSVNPDSEKPVPPKKAPPALEVPVAPKVPEKPVASPALPKAKTPPASESKGPTQTLTVKEKSRFDTVMRFAAKELGGSLKKE